MRLGDDGRYVVRRQLGEGTFGRVLSCLDSETGSKVAVKVVKGVKRYCEHAEAEAEVLQEILRCDPGRQSLCVQLLDSFVHPRRHYCLVFEPLATSIRDFLKDNDQEGLYLADIRSVTRQLLRCLSFLHAIGVTHTDLKCRNVMLRDSASDVLPHPRRKGAETMRPRNCQIAVIDFGGAVFADERHDGRIGTRQFRAPEVVLGLKWDETADLWSTGCIIAMLYTGQRLFRVHEDLEHLAMAEKIVGTKIPEHLAREAASKGALPLGVQVSEGRLVWPGDASHEVVKRVEGLDSLRDIIQPSHDAFLRLLEGLLCIDPRKRTSAASLLESQFVLCEEVLE